MARDGIHAVLVVFSICKCFSEEERAVICGLVDLFGNKIYDYMIIVFTCGDELDEEGKSLDEFLSGCSEQLKFFGNRCVLFDNRSKDEAKKLIQVHELLSQVNMVLDKNGGKPYSSEIFAMFKVKSFLVHSYFEKSHTPKT
ncbi:putative AIG1-type guanine nucleotide-binding (G) domain-containing protein [Helianthus debilis subsp. tardiflorus]